MRDRVKGIEREKERERKEEKDIEIESIRESER